MDLFLQWRVFRTTIFVYILDIFISFHGVSGQTSPGTFPKSILSKAGSLCDNCATTCRYEPEPESMCFAVCNCRPARAKAKCDQSEQCRCPWSSDNKCPLGSTQACLFDDGVVCEFETRYCVENTELEVAFRSNSFCECKPGWSGPPSCLECDSLSCEFTTAGGSSNSNQTALILGFVLAIVVLILIIVVIAYWRLGRLPCYTNKKRKGNANQFREKPPLGMAYSVSGPMPNARQAITHGPGQRPGIVRPDADTGEIDGEYAYAAISDYAMIPNRDQRDMPPEPIASVSREHNAEAIYYFKLHDDTVNTTNTIQTVPTKNIADCYTKVIRKPKTEEHPVPPPSQYDRLDRINNGRPSPNIDRGSPSDNEYGTLGSSI